MNQKFKHLNRPKDNLRNKFSCGELDIKSNNSSKSWSRPKLQTRSVFASVFGFVLAFALGHLLLTSNPLFSQQLFNANQDTSANQDSPAQLQTPIEPFKRIGGYGEGIAYNGVYKIVFSLDGKQLATRNQDQTVRLFDLDTAKAGHILAKQEFRITDLLFSPNQKQLVTVSDQDDSPILFWDLESGQVVRTITANARMVRFKEDGPLEVADNQRQAKVGFQEREVVSNHRKWSSNRSGLLLGMSRNGNQIACFNLFDKNKGHFQILQWNPRMQTSVVGSFQEQPTMAEFSADGLYVAACCKRDKNAYLWSLKDTSKKKKLVGHSGPVQQIAFSNDTRYLATASWDKSVKIWEVASGSLLLTLSGHQEKVAAVAFNHSDSVLASGATGRTDCSVALWDFRELLFVQRRGSEEFSKALTKKNLNILLSREGDAAYKSIAYLVQHGDLVIPTIRSELVLDDFPKTEKIKQLIAQLNSAKYLLREAAEKQLLAIRATAQGLLQNELRETQSPEVQFRLRRILSDDQVFPKVSESEKLQMNRLTLALELMESEQSEKLLKRIAVSFPSIEVQNFARTSLARISRATKEN